VETLSDEFAKTTDEQDSSSTKDKTNEQKIIDIDTDKGRVTYNIFAGSERNKK
jgi:hypothetical protein